MRKNMLLLVMGIALIFFASIPAMAQSFPKATGYVSDFAHFLSEEDGRALNSELVAFEQKTSIEMAVVIVTSLDGKDVKTYADELGNAWGVGKRGANNGVVFLLAPNEKKLWISPGGGVSYFLPEHVCNDIREKVVRWASSKQQGIIDGTHAIMRVLEGGSVFEQAAPSTPLQPRTEQSEPTRGSGLSPFLVGFLVLCVLGVFGTVPRVFDFLEERRVTIRLQASVLSDFPKVEQEVAHEDVSTDVRAKFASLKKDYLPLAQNAFTPRKMSWTQLHDQLKGISTTLANISRDSKIIIADAAKARERGPELMKDFPDMLARAKNKLAKGKYSKDAKKRLQSAERRYQAACAQQSGMTLVDWIILYEILSLAESDIGRAESIHESYNAPPSPPSESHSGTHQTSESSSSRSSDSNFGDSGGYSGGSDFGGGGGGDW